MESGSIKSGCLIQYNFFLSLEREKLVLILQNLCIDTNNVLYRLHLLSQETSGLDHSTNQNLFNTQDKIGAYKSDVFVELFPVFFRRSRYSFGLCPLNLRTLNYGNRIRMLENPFCDWTKCCHGG